METLHPGLYFQEVAGVPAMQGASTSTGAFVGVAPKGKVGEAVLVTNWTQYVKEFGSFDKNSYLAYAVKGFFENGGSRAYISRAVKVTDGVKASAPALHDVEVETNLLATFRAKSDGVWGNSIAITIENPTVDKFDLLVSYKGAVVESFKAVPMVGADAVVISDYIEVVIVDETKALTVVTNQLLTGGNDGITGITDVDYLGDITANTGLQAFNNVEVNLVAISGITSVAVQKGLISYCENRGDCFAVLETPLGLNPVQAEEYVTTTANLASEYSAIYYPNIKVVDHIGLGKNPMKVVPPSGHIMGVMARTDAKQGVWKAPAGVDCKVLGAVEVEYNVADAEQDILNPSNINCIRSLDGEGICVWGTRTLSNGEYKYIPVRRTVLMIKASLNKSMKWTAFQPNDERLWGRITATVSAFLSDIHGQGGLKGGSSSEAYMVKCDAELNTQDVIDLGKTYVDIAIAPQKPAEFIIFRLSLKR